MCIQCTCICEQSVCELYTDDQGTTENSLFTANYTLLLHLLVVGLVHERYEISQLLSPLDTQCRVYTYVSIPHIRAKWPQGSARMQPYYVGGFDFPPAGLDSSTLIQHQLHS